MKKLKVFIFLSGICSFILFLSKIGVFIILGCFFLLKWINLLSLNSMFLLRLLISILKTWSSLAFLSLLLLIGLYPISSIFSFLFSIILSILYIELFFFFGRFSMIFSFSLLKNLIVFLVLISVKLFISSFSDKLLLIICLFSFILKFSDSNNKFDLFSFIFNWRFFNLFILSWGSKFFDFVSGSLTWNFCWFLLVRLE